MSSGAPGLNFISLAGQPFGYRDVTAAGTGQSTATALASFSGMAYFVSSADGTKGVKLPSANRGKFVIVKNDDAATGTCPVYPFLGGTINGGSANGAYTVAVGATVMFVAHNTTDWSTLSSSGGSSSSTSSASSFNAATGITISGATTPSVTTAAGSTNTGFLLVNGKTSGSLKITTADATAQAIVITGAAQTVGGTTLTIPDFAGVSDTFVFATKSATLANKTLADSTINQSFKTLATQAFNSGGTGSTLTNLTGLSWTVAASGTYYFDIVVPLLTQTTNGGSKMAFKLTTATLTQMNLRVCSSTDTDNTGAVSTSFTSTTDQATWFDQKVTVFTYVRISGSFTVGTGGTIAVQAAQNTSHVDTTTFAGTAASLIRTA